MKSLGYLVLALLLLSAPSAMAETRKYALVVGNNEGHKGSKELRYAESDAHKFYEAITDVGGFSSDRAKLILGGSAEGVLKELKSIEQKIKRDNRAKIKTLLLFYYSGHAEGEVMELGASSLKFTNLKKLLISSKANVRLAFLDSCRSGQLIGHRAGKRSTSFDIQLSEELASEGFAIITSSAGDEASQETVEIRGGYFTHYLVSALRGAGDETGDGKITLDEAYRYAYKRTTARTSTSIGGAQHPMYQFQLKGKGEVVLANLTRATSQLAVTGPGTGRLIVLDRKEENLVAELDLDAGTRAEISIKPGAYRVYYLGAKGRVLKANATVVKGKTAQLQSGDFKKTTLKTAVNRGGLFANPQGLSHRIGLGALWRRRAVEESLSSYGAVLHYRLLTTINIEPVLRLRWATSGSDAESKGYHEFGGELGLGYVFRLPFGMIRAEALGGIELIRQKQTDGKNPLTSGYSYMGLLGFELPIKGGWYAAVSGGAGGRIFRLEGEGAVHRLDIQVAGSVGWSWER